MNIDTEWPRRAAVLLDELVECGKLTSPGLQAAVLTVPRHVFVPRFHVREPGRGWLTLSRADDVTRDRWWDGVYANTSLVTRIGPVATGGPDAVGATSSSSAPGLMTRMIEALDLRWGHRVLEIGTGTGYNAALLSRLVGAENVYSIDVDADLVTEARAGLAGIGLCPTLAVADGVKGLPDRAAYDRIEATCAVSWIPPAWSRQVVDGGLVLADVKVHATVGNLVLLRRDGSTLQGRFDPGTATFMLMRTAEFAYDRRPPARRNHVDATARTTGSPAGRVWHDDTLWFVLHLSEPGRLDFGFARDERTDGPGAIWFSSPDGSWCEVAPASEGPERAVWEGGPRRLWAAIEAASAWWEREGRPDWDRFGLTVTPDDQVVWLDDPHGPNRWRLPQPYRGTRSATDVTRPPSP